MHVTLLRGLGFCTSRERLFSLLDALLMKHHLLRWMTFLSKILRYLWHIFFVGHAGIGKTEIDAHKGATIKCILYSMEGDETIHTVGAIMYSFGTGTRMC